MSSIHLCGVYLLTFVFLQIDCAYPPSLRYPLPIVSNKITDVNLTCDSDNLNVTISLQYPFKGVLFAKDFSQECKSFGSLSNIVSINLPTSSCGIRLSSRTDSNGSSEMFYSITLTVQQDRHLRQITDQEKYLECPIKDNAFIIKSQTMVDVVKNNLLLGADIRSSRVGRMRLGDWSKQSANSENSEEIDKELTDALSAARAWMEITSENINVKSTGTLKVGEPALLTVKSTLPAGIGFKVIDCYAHDGLGDASQRLLDDNGCPFDELLLPIPQLGPIRPIALMRHQEAVAKFAAFKFPDRDRLHLSCALQLCKGVCPQNDCSMDSNNTGSDNRLGRTLTKDENGEILDRLEVFNSVEVLAPAIDDLRKSEKFQSDDSTVFSAFSHLPGDRTFCISPDKMAITFCVLGIIFLIAVIVATCALLRARRSGHNGPFYTRSIFSSSSGGSAYGSKLLLHESPCLGQSSSRRLHYGRIL